MTVRRYSGQTPGPAASIRSLPIGERTSDTLRAARLGDRPAPDTAVFNYDHLLSDFERECDLALRIYENGNRFQACLGHEGDQIGHWRGVLLAPSLCMGHAWLDEYYRNSGLGRQMLLALLVHAAHRGALLVRGGIHSTSAHRTHESIAREFGLDYRAALREEMENMEERPEDQRYDEYDYVLDRPDRSRK